MKASFVTLCAAAALSATLMFGAARTGGAGGKVNAKQAAGDKERGAEVFKQNCSVCHYADKTDRRVGPGLKGLFKRDKLVNGKPVNDANVHDLIWDGTQKMMGFKERLDKQQIDDVIAYLHTL